MGYLFSYCLGKCPFVYLFKGLVILLFFISGEGFRGFNYGIFNFDLSDFILLKGSIIFRNS